ncbi:hypothetical protein LINPERHAP1_LOCUS10739 [Linum perenne]
MFLCCFSSLNKFWEALRRITLHNERHGTLPLLWLPMLFSTNADLALMYWWQGACRIKREVNRS